MTAFHQSFQVFRYCILISQKSDLVSRRLRRYCSFHQLVHLCLVIPLQLIHSSLYLVAKLGIVLSGSYADVSHFLVVLESVVFVKSDELEILVGQQRRLSSRNVDNGYVRNVV